MCDRGRERESESSGALVSESREGGDGVSSPFLSLIAHFSLSFPPHLVSFHSHSLKKCNVEPGKGERDGERRERWVGGKEGGRGGGSDGWRERGRGRGREWGEREGREREREREREVVESEESEEEERNREEGNEKMRENHSEYERIRERACLVWDAS